MSIPSFLKKVCVQTAVYWGTPVPDGYGGMTYAEPVEIKVRWEDVSRTVSDRDGKEIYSKATVLLQQNVDIEGYLYLGTLDSLLSTNPMEVDTAFQIVGVSRIPMVKSTTVFVHTAYLGFKNVQ
jgi:hypothetical protein